MSRIKQNFYKEKFEQFLNDLEKIKHLNPNNTYYFQAKDLNDLMFEASECLSVNVKDEVMEDRDKAEIIIHVLYASQDLRCSDVGKGIDLAKKVIEL